MRVVVDTNVFVGACIGRGASSHVIEACLSRRLRPFISPALLYEYRDVISRSTLYGNARLNQRERGVLLRAFVSRCEWQEVYFRWRPNLRDEADNHIIELAIAEILRPEQLIERLAQ